MHRTPVEAGAQQIRSVANRRQLGDEGLAVEQARAGARHTHRLNAFSTRSTNRRPPKSGSEGTVGGLKGGATSEMSHLRTGVKMLLWELLPS